MRDSGQGSSRGATRGRVRRLIVATVLTALVLALLSVVLGGPRLLLWLLGIVSLAIAIHASIHPLLGALHPVLTVLISTLSVIVGFIAHGGVTRVHSFPHTHKDASGDQAVPTRGIAHSHARPHGPIAWFASRFVFPGIARRVQRKALVLADLRPGESVLDVGCGTGMLAIEAQQRVGAAGRVCGVDPVGDNIERARSTATRKRLAVDFRTGVVEQLPFENDSFDAVLSTIMMHHLPDDLRSAGLSEIARVLRPGGRLVIADFIPPEERLGRSARFHAGGTSIEHLSELIEATGSLRADMKQTMAARESGLPGVPGFPGAGLLRAYKTRPLSP
jgi:ubiquinone/menaquinone biosynthesis C-methylase UbiE